MANNAIPTIEKNLTVGKVVEGATIPHLKAMAKLVPYKNAKVAANWHDYLQSRSTGVARMCITLAHMLGYVGEIDAWRIGTLLLRSYKGKGESIAYGGAGASPRLHYTHRNGKVGIADPYAKGYDGTAPNKGNGAHPARFAENYGLPSNDWLLECESHKRRYIECKAECNVAVVYKRTVGGLFAEVVGNTTEGKAKAKAAKTKADKAAKAKAKAKAIADATPSEVKATNERRERIEKANTESK